MWRGRRGRRRRRDREGGGRAPKGGKVRMAAAASLLRMFVGTFHRFAGRLGVRDQPRHPQRDALCVMDTKSEAASLQAFAGGTRGSFGKQLTSHRRSGPAYTIPKGQRSIVRWTRPKPHGTTRPALTTPWRPCSPCVGEPLHHQAAHQAKHTSRRPRARHIGLLLRWDAVDGFARRKCPEDHVRQQQEVHRKGS